MTKFNNQDISNFCDELSDGRFEIITAAENGSRAWGYNSPNSDHDVKGVVYYKDTNRYQSVFTYADFWKWQPDELVDITFWDLKKFLGLLYKGNATCYEIVSQHKYCSNDQFRELYNFTVNESQARLRDIAYHYYGISNKTYRQRIVNTGERTPKKYLYMMRPLLHIHQIYYDRKLPNLHFPTLLNECEDAMLSPVFEITSLILASRRSGKDIKLKQKETDILDKFIEKRNNFWQIELKTFNIDKQDKSFPELEKAKFDQFFRDMINK